MDTGDYKKQQRNRICVVYIIAGTIIVLAAFLLGMGMWLKALILALFGIAFLMTPLALSSESERRSRLLFVLGILFGTAATAVLIYGICAQIF
jgi:4-hydroxybenzoate polyprenyltransferase